MGLDFKPIEINGKGIFDHYLTQDPPQISELTFTNLFMWRHKYNPSWCEEENCLLIILNPDSDIPFGLPPVGKGDKGRALKKLFQYLKTLDSEAFVSRADKDFVDQYVDSKHYDSLKGYR